MADDAAPTHKGEPAAPAVPESEMRPAPEPSVTDYLDPLSPNHAVGRAMNAPGRWIDEQVQNAGERIADMTGWRPTPPTYQPLQPPAAPEPAAPPDHPAAHPADPKAGAPATPASDPGPGVGEIRPAPEPGVTDYLDPLSPNHAFGRAMNAPGRWIDEQVQNAGERIADMTGWRPTPPPYQPTPPVPPGYEPLQPAVPPSYAPLQPPEPPSFGPVDAPEPLSYPPLQPPAPPPYPPPGVGPDPSIGVMRPAPEPGVTDYLDPLSPNHAFGRAMNAPGRWIDEQVQNAGERIADMTGWRPTPPTYQPSQPPSADGGIHLDGPAGSIDVGGPGSGIHLDGPGGSVDVGGPGGSIDFVAGFGLGSQPGNPPATSDAILDHGAGVDPAGPIDFSGSVDTGPLVDGTIDPAPMDAPTYSAPEPMDPPDYPPPEPMDTRPEPNRAPPELTC